MGKKIIGEASLMIAMAKHIKACKKNLKDSDKTEAYFKFNWSDGMTEVSFADKVLCVNETLSVERLGELVAKALEESSCKGTILSEWGKYRVILYGSPTKAFRMLQRLIQKYSGVFIDWDTCKSIYFDGNGAIMYDKTAYLCYNETTCQDGIDFIRKNRTSKDVLNAVIKVDSGDETGNFSITNCLSLSVETPHGKCKGEVLLFEI